MSRCPRHPCRIFTFVRTLSLVALACPSCLCMAGADQNEKRQHALPSLRYADQGISIYTINLGVSSIAVFCLRTLLWVVRGGQRFRKVYQWCVQPLTFLTCGVPTALYALDCWGRFVCFVLKQGSMSWPGRNVRVKLGRESIDAFNTRCNGNCTMLGYRVYHSPGSRGEGLPQQERCKFFRPLRGGGGCLRPFCPIHENLVWQHIFILRVVCDNTR